ncbi:MAG: hypothetical protein R3F43_17530 [bacterium]
MVRARAQLALARDAQAIAGRRLAEAEARRAGGLTTDADALAVKAQVAGVARLVALASGRAVVADANLRDLLEIPRGGHPAGRGSGRPALRRRRMWRRCWPAARWPAAPTWPPPAPATRPPAPGPTPTAPAPGRPSPSA